MAWSGMKPQKTELALVFHIYKRTHKHTKSSYAHKEGLRAFIRKGGKSMGVYVDGGSLTVVVCAGVLETCHLPEYSDAPVRAWRGLFSGAVHAHRFPEGKIQLVSASGSGAELRRAVPKCNL